MPYVLDHAAKWRRQVTGLFLTGICVSAICGAAHASEWSVSVLGVPKAVSLPVDGGFIIAGRALDRQLIPGAWLLKLNGSGEAVWQKTYRDPPDYWNEAIAVQPTADGGYFVAGQSDPSSSARAWVLRLSGDGTIVWSRKFGGEGVQYATSLATTVDGGLVVAGWTTKADFTGADGLVLRLDAKGDTLWQKKYYDMSANAIQTTGEGGFIVAGAATVSGIQGLSLLKLDAGGNVTWHKIYVPSEGPASVSATLDTRSVQTTTDGGFVVAGGARGTGTSAKDAWVLRLDRVGNIVWQRFYGGPADDLALSIQPTADGYVVAGQKDYICEVDVRVPICAAQHAAAWILKLDARGEIVWQKTYAPLSSDYNYAASAGPTADGGYIVVGVSLYSALGWVLKLDANGDIGSCAQLGTSEAMSNASTVVAQNGSTLAIAASPSALPSAFLAELDASPPQQQCNALPPPSQLAVEYYQQDYNHYFVTSSKPEIAALDAGAFPGWGRTGEYFRVLEMGAGNANVCRFWSGPSFAPRSSHFYTPFESECAALKTNPTWQFEGEVFSMHLTGDGSCANGTAPLYRLYNNSIGGAPNHRYTTREYIRSQTITQGWIPEGVGIGVLGCVPLD